MGHTASNSIGGSTPSIYIADWSMWNGGMILETRNAHHMCPTRRQQARLSHMGSYKGTSPPHLYHHPPLSHWPLLWHHLLQPLPAWGGRPHHMPMRTHPLCIMGSGTLASLPHQGACDIQVPTLHLLPPHSLRGPFLPLYHTPVQGTHCKIMRLPPWDQLLAPTPTDKALGGFETRPRPNISPFTLLTWYLAMLYNSTTLLHYDDTSTCMWAAK